MESRYTSSLDPDELFYGFQISEELSAADAKFFRLKDWNELADELPPSGLPNRAEVAAAALLSVCSCCWTKLDKHLQCSLCNETRRELRNAWYENTRKRRLEQDLCPSCGADRDVPGRKNCAKCMKKVRERARFNYHLRRTG